MSLDFSFSEKKIRRRRMLSFFSDVMTTLLGVVVFLLLRYIIKFPNIFLNPVSRSISERESWNFSFLCLGISPFIHTSMVMNFIFFFLQRKEIDPITLKKIKSWLYRSILIIACIFGGITTFYELITETLKTDLSSGLLRVFLFFITILVIYCCLFDLLILFFNKFGVCDIFNIYFVFYIAEGLKIAFEWKNSVYFILASLMAFSWFLITNCKWGVPVRSNAVSNIEDDQKSSFLKRDFKLEFKFNFSSFHLYNITTLLRCFFSLFAVAYSWNRNWDKIESNKPGFWSKLLKVASVVAKQQRSLIAVLPNWMQLVYKINSSLLPFSEKEVRMLLNNHSGFSIISCGIFFILFRWFIVYCQRKYMDLKGGEIAKDLRQRGIYIDGVQPGYPTYKLIDKNLSRMVHVWFLVQFIGNILFDNLVFLIFKNTLSFISWLNLINTEKELIQQISTKISYTFGSY